MHLMLQLVQRYLGGPPAPPPDAELARYLTRCMRADGLGLGAAGRPASSTAG